MPRLLKLTTPPPFLPVTVEDAKAHLRIDGTDEDGLIRSYLEAATDDVQETTDRQLITASYAYSFHWEHFGWDRCGWGLIDHHYRVELPRSPLVSVESITYIDANGATQTLDSSAYRVVIDQTPGYVHFVNPPTSLSTREDAITINYTSGYGNPEDVPPLLLLAVLRQQGKHRGKAALRSAVRRRAHPF